MNKLLLFLVVWFGVSISLAGIPAPLVQAASELFRASYSGDSESVISKLSTENAKSEEIKESYRAKIKELSMERPADFISFNQGVDNVWVVSFKRGAPVGKGDQLAMVFSIKLTESGFELF